MIKRIGRVHWLLHYLTKEFKNQFIISYDYVYHNYTFYRVDKSGLIDIYIVVRTSRLSFKCTYSNIKKSIYYYFTTKNAKSMADKILKIFKYNQ